jgi:hypothetical protein
MDRYRGERRRLEGFLLIWGARVGGLGGEMLPDLRCLGRIMDIHT